ncbi:MAG: hypothetical protein ABH826_04195 [Patescibacteria group bacterium]|nr:hypothetical protein [Patescibacteria group bacterium]
MENLSFNEQEFFEEVVARALEEGVANKEAFDEYVDQAVREHERWGELHDDNDLDGIVTQVQARWGEYQEILDNKTI